MNPPSGSGPHLLEKFKEMYKAKYRKWPPWKNVKNCIELYIVKLVDWAPIVNCIYLGSSWYMIMTRHSPFCLLILSEFINRPIHNSYVCIIFCMYTLCIYLLYPIHTRLNLMYLLYLLHLLYLLYLPYLQCPLYV